MVSYSTGHYVSPPIDQYLKFKNHCNLVCTFVPVLWIRIWWIRKMDFWIRILSSELWIRILTIQQILEKNKYFYVIIKWCTVFYNG